MVINIKNKETIDKLYLWSIIFDKLMLNKRQLLPQGNENQALSQA